MVYNRYMKKRVRESKQTRGGFTLAELIVVVAIVSLFGTVTISKYSDFENNTLLTTLAQDVALSVRQAQLFGVSVRGVGSDFTIGYGVYFDLEDPDTYILFADTAGADSLYSESDTEIDIYTLGNGHTISDIRQVGGPNGEEYTELHLVFRRPDPGSEVALQIEGSSGHVDRTGEIVEIDVTSTTGETRTIRVTPTGQISVKMD